MVIWLIELTIRAVAWAIGAAIMVAIGAACLLYALIRGVVILVTSSISSEAEK